MKHHFGMPELAVGACLDAAGMRAGPAAGDNRPALRHVAFYMDPGRWLRSAAAYFVRRLPRSAAYLGREPALWRSFHRVERRFREFTGFEGKFHNVDHHTAHIDSAFYPSGFESAAAITIDGAGESTTTTISRVDEQSIRRVAGARYPHSIGKAWEAVTDWLGWTPTQDEGKLMGLAPFGSDRFTDELADAISVPRDARDKRIVQVDESLFQYQFGAQRLVSPEFERRFGPARRPGEAIEDHHRDVAHALQLATERAVIALATHARRETGESRLVMAGGVALNCVANGALVRSGIFDEVFVQPAAGDSGAGLGAALHVAHRRLGVPRGAPQTHAALGPGTEPRQVTEAVQRCSPEVRVERLDDVAGSVAALLAEGQVVGWMQGQMEFGPRALGQRSILADPRDPETARRVNERVKFRETFRPFAPSVPLEHVGDWFVDGGPSPYMLLAFEVRPERRARIPAVTHVDGTARVQTVDRDVQPLYHRLLTEFGRITGVPVLLNTSFNVRGEPIVATPAEALDALLRTGLDAVVIGDVLCRRNVVST